MTTAQKRNIINVSWGDQLMFGEGDGLLNTPEAVLRRMKLWRDELGAGTIHWRQMRRHQNDGKVHAARGYKYAIPRLTPKVDWDDLAVVPSMAHEMGMTYYLYTSIFDEGRPLPPKKVREVSYHNAMHNQHFCWQSYFTMEHPEYVMVDRTGQHRQWGVLCLAYPEVREYLIKRFESLVEGNDMDGLFVCLRSQSRPADFADQFGFNEPVRRDYQERYGRDIRTEDFDVQLWRDLLGGYLTLFLTELRGMLRERGMRLAVGCARGRVIGPPLGNATLDLERWAREDVIDELVIEQNSSQCPSLHHHLWPMHRGYGYVQNYVDGHNMLPLEEDLTETGKALTNGHTVDLYVSRQWSDRSEEEEESLLAHEAVSGLAFSSFRFDNAGPLARADWVI